LGDLIKLAAFLGTLLLSYAILSMLLQYIGFLLPLSSSASAPRRRTLTLLSCATP